MTKKDFQMIADVLRVYADDGDPAAESMHRAICNRFADRLFATNPLFNRGKFLAACGVKS